MGIGAMSGEHLRYFGKNIFFEGLFSILPLALHLLEHTYHGVQGVLMRGLW